jgi:hypothetical protein
MEGGGLYEAHTLGVCGDGVVGRYGGDNGTPGICRWFAENIASQRNGPLTPAAVQV